MATYNTNPAAELVAAEQPPMDAQRKLQQLAALVDGYAESAQATNSATS